MKMPLSIAERLLQLARGEQMPASKMKHEITDDLISEGIIAAALQGRTKSTLYIADKAAFNNYLYNRWAIANLEDYISVLKNDATTRAELIQASNDSKSAHKRTFRGFLVNSYLPVEAVLNGRPLTIHPQPRTFQFIYDFEKFIPAGDVVIVGVENAENFCSVEKQQYLFPGLKILFVSRYPQGQSRDLIKWLQSLPNRYLHFGDYDFAGIGIYLAEYKKHLGDRASFFIPTNIEQLLTQFGNRKLYDKQRSGITGVHEENIKELIGLIHKYKKGLEQEILIAKKA